MKIAKSNIVANVVLIALVEMTSCAQAQVVPDAGAIRQQIERDLPAAPPKPVRLKGGARLDIQHIEAAIADGRA